VVFDEKGDQAIPKRGAGRNFALLTVKAEFADDRVGYDHAIRIEHIIRSAATTLIPAVCEFTTETDSQFEVRSQLRAS